MRVLFVHHTLGNFSGAESNILITASELQARGHSLALLFNQISNRGEAPWNDAFQMRLQVSNLQTANDQFEATRKHFRPDLIYFHAFPRIEVLEAALQTGIPVVRMVHDHELYCMRGYKYNVLTRRICKRSASGYCVFPCLGCVVRNKGDGWWPFALKSYKAKLRELELNRRCSAWVVYSDYSRQELVRNGFDADRILIHVPISRVSAHIGDSCLSDRNLILFAGQIIRGKGVDVLLKSLARVKSPFECVILGEGNSRSRCERLSRRLGLQNRVRFAGYVNSEALHAYYHEATVMVVPSVWAEPFGMVGPEAMRLGIPVVAFDVGGIKEWLHDGINGFTVPWMDIDGFASAIDRIINNKPLARVMGQRGKAWVASEYEVGRQVNRLERLFEDLLLVTADRNRPQFVPHSESSNQRALVSAVQS